MLDLQTPSQTVGPYFALGLTPRQYGINFDTVFNQVLFATATAPRIHIVGRVFDGESVPINDAMIEIFQGDAGGDAFDCGRCGTGTDAALQFRFDTVKPAANGAAPHIDVVVFMRGLLSHAYTRIYFDDEAIANADDELLKAVPPARRNTLMARREQRPEGVVYVFDIHMQGARETVFFDF